MESLTLKRRKHPVHSGYLTEVENLKALISDGQKANLYSHLKNGKIRLDRTDLGIFGIMFGDSKTQEAVTFKRQAGMAMMDNLIQSKMEADWLEGVDGYNLFVTTLKYICGRGTLVNIKRWL